MLRKISCDLFRKKEVIFEKGLNVVLGDDNASNSIGKTTMLLIVDFALGGESYITAKNDAIEALGHHEFKIEFVFNEEHLYFKRTTTRSKYVSCCDEKYQELTEITLEDYTKLLKERYAIGLPYITFRSIVGLFSRIWGKKNYNTDEPLQQNKSKMPNAINNLIMLFGKYESLKSLEDQIFELEEEKKIIDRAIKKNYLPKANKTIYKANLNEIERLTVEIESLANDASGVKTNLEALITEEILEMKNLRSSLVSKMSVYEDRLSRTQFNLSRKKQALNQKLNQLIEYFPNINLDKLEKIDSFHSKISKALKSELMAAEKELKDMILTLKDQIHDVDDEIDLKLELDDGAKYVLNRVADLMVKKEKLKETNRLCDHKTRISEVLPKTKKQLSEIKDVILQDISSIINLAMHELNKKIVIDERKAPNLQLLDKKYSFKVFDDTGTGTSYVSLITLDLAILDKTELPLLIHDSILFKNVENPSMENIIALYESHDKQIFIAIDEINTKFSQDVIAILKTNEVISLSHDFTLFCKDWKNKDMLIEE